MASKKKAARAGGQPQGPNKSAFIRGLPVDMSAAEVVAKAKADGLAISTNFVSAVRSKMKAGGKPGKSAGSKAKPGPKPKAGRKARSGPQPREDGKPSASDFVRSMPAEAKASEVVAAAKKQGIKMSTNLVYAVRSAAARRGGGPKGRPGPKPRAASAGGASSDTIAFKKLAFGLGIARARQALDELERGLRDLISG
jgi:hypothetical protein